MSASRPESTSGLLEIPDMGETLRSVFNCINHSQSLERKRQGAFAAAVCHAHAAHCYCSIGSVCTSVHSAPSKLRTSSSCGKISKGLIRHEGCNVRSP